MTPKRFSKLKKYSEKTDNKKLKEYININIYRNTLGDDLSIRNEKRV
jgi:hypothetical protein